MCPSAFATGLRQPRSSLPCPNVKPPRTFEPRQVPRGLARDCQLLPGKGRQPNGLDEFALLITQHLEEFDQFRVQVVVRLDSVWPDVEKHRCRAAEHVAEMRGVCG